ISAASGISTMAERNSVAKPSVNPNPGNTLGLTHPRAAAIKRYSVSSAAPRLEREEEPVVDAAVVEVHGLRLAPAALKHVAHGEQPDLGEARGIARRDFGIARPEVILGADLLAYRRVEKLEIRLGDGARAAAIDDRVDERDG